MIIATCTHAQTRMWKATPNPGALFDVVFSTKDFFVSKTPILEQTAMVNSAICSNHQNDFFGIDLVQLTITNENFSTIFFQFEATATTRQPFAINWKTNIGALFRGTGL